MLTRFRYRAMGMLEYPPADNDPARWLFLMQHHGLPTRLLDWSESALAAVFFAVADKPDTDGCLYILVPMALNEQKVKQRVLLAPTSSPCSEIMWASFKGSKMPPKIVAISTYASNDRLARQRGTFTVHGITDDLCNIVASNVLRSIVIPSTLKRGLLEALAHLGITRTSLFHDLDALAWEMREQYDIS
ncbi:FRG domain protein [Nitrosococcus halophilus Nc 4]|uniref:FRG domain protein n=2 Tax=Nitrosococcus halophilus TaxID=133539 RepID=D5C3D4_NITHN|nr:FRG domain protein [Nitrosococcus halophilus Nc 4]